MSSLMHHGVKGQRWGVRRFQNKDGTRTAAGKKHYSVEAVDADFTRSDIKKLVNGFSRKDKQMFFDRRYPNEKYDKGNEVVAKRFVVKEGKDIVAFIDANERWTSDNLNVVIGTSKSARGKGYASVLSKKMVDWYEEEGHKKHGMLEWNAYEENVGSRKAAEKAGFKQISSGYDQTAHYVYSKTSKKELNNLSTAYRNKSSVEKEVSDKINSDFQKTKFGKFSPKTTISAYGSAYTPYDSELGFYKSMIVDRHASKWAKKHHSEDIARYDKATSDWSSAYETFNKKRRRIKHTSIGGTMYIEGNALILGDSSYLEHHGILGQKWGVRRFQNKDGTRTAAGKTRDQKNAAKQVVLANRRTRNQWQYQNSFTKAQDKLTNKSRDSVREMAMDALNGKHKAEYDTAVEEYDAATNYRYDEYRKEENKYLAIAGMASGNRYPMLDPDKFDQDTRLKWDAEFYMYDDGDQGKYNSYDYFLVAKGENPNKVFDRAMKARNNIESIADKDVDDILGDYKDHPINSKVLNTTIKTTAGDALKERIVDMATSASDYTMVWEHQISYTDDEIKSMKNDIKKYEKEAKRLGLIHSDLSIEDGTLYLSHHGIRGQRWGVRRFQNRDGSLTNAGRKRLGYATKGVTQTVGKAFKAGVKAGGNAVKAVKAHHEKKEAEKKEKKKEKASKTRLGVMANKDLFTNEEIRKLNERFKLEDEMKMATLQKGVEIAKAVGTIAQNVGTVAKTYEDVTGQSLSPIKRKAAEEKARQDKEDRERRIAREDADEARKAAKEERDIAIHEQTLRKAIASADTQEFTAQKTKAEADSSILDLYKKGQDFNGGSDATGKSWMEKATAGGKNVFEQMKYDNDPEYKAAKDAHDEKVARKERMAELDRREKEREAEKAAASRPQQPQQKQNNDDALFSQKGSLPIDKDRYKNSRAIEKAKHAKEDAAEERAKKQDEKAAKATIDDMMEARRQFTDSARANSNGAFDRETAANYIKGKAKELPSKLNPINAISKKITDKALKEQEDASRKAMEDEYKKASRSQGRDEANYTMYYNRINALQAQGYSERQAKKVADTESPFSSKRNRRFEYNEKVGEIEATHRKNSKEINKANKELTDYYYKLINGPGYDPGTPKREALDRKYAQKRGELERLEKDNNDMLDREKKKAKKILEHSLTIQNGVLFINAGEPYLEHHGVKGQRWGVRRFQNPDGTLTDAGKRREARQMARELNRLDSRQATASRNYSNLSMHKGYYDRKVGKLEYKKSISDEKGDLKKSEKLQKKIDKGKANVERISKMMKFASDDYNASEKKVRDIISKINKSTDYAWKTMAIEREFTSYNGKFYKDMKKNAGKPKLFEGNYYESAYGNHYTVKHDKSGKRKRKWEASKQQRQTHNPAHTVHYYY